MHILVAVLIIDLKTSKIQRPMPSVNIFTKKHASYTMRLPFNGFVWRKNENSDTVELPVMDSICPPDLLSSDRGSGQECGTGLRDRATGPGYETMIQIREPFKVAGHLPGSH